MDGPVDLSVNLAQAVPLCVDLDGTLVRSDMLMEGMFALAASPVLYQALLGMRRSGRAGFKARIAAAAGFDPALLPYHHGLLADLRQQKARGRRIVLVTAADQTVAGRIAAHLGLFDEVIASDGVRNLKGAAKARLLRDRFGPGGFDYAGDSRADLPVWKDAQAAILVNARRRVARAARDVASIQAEYNDRRRPGLALMRAARPHQWVKNLLVFIPLFVSGNLPALHAVAAALLAFAAFSATASGIYQLNDLADLRADRKHPRKRARPFASGAVSLQAGLASAMLLVLLGLSLAAASGIAAIVALYAAVSASYSAKLKELPLVDVFILAALYSIRLLGGGVATGTKLSLWLLAFSSFLFLGLALVKRVGELGASGSMTRRGYQPGDVAILQTFGCACSVAATLVLALFVQDEATAERYASPMVLWGIVPLILFWQCRIWLSTARGYMLDDPIVYAARDRVSWAIAAAAVLLVLAARFWPVIG